MEENKKLNEKEVSLEELDNANGGAGSDSKCKDSGDTPVFYVGQRLYYSGWSYGCGVTVIEVSSEKVLCKNIVGHNSYQWQYKVRYDVKEKGEETLFEYEMQDFKNSL